MIEEIKIDGILYKLIENPIKETIACNVCDLIMFCNKNNKFIDVCVKLNSEEKYLFKKQ